MRIGTWNILSGHATSGGAHASLAEEVATLDLDVLGLNEVDCHWQRSGFAFQAQDAAHAMGAVDWRFAPSFRGEDRARGSSSGLLIGPNETPVGAHYGIALLSRIPVRRWHRLELGKSRIGLPLLSSRDGERAIRYVRDEPHVAVAAELENDWVAIATHLSFVAPVAVAQLLRLRRWALTLGKRAAIVGDMNLARAMIVLRPNWQSAVNANTYPSWNPRVQFDHVLLPRDVIAKRIQLGQPSISDHLPIAVDVD